MINITNKISSNLFFIFLSADVAILLLAFHWAVLS